MAQFLAQNNIHLFALLEIKVKQKKIWALCTKTCVQAGASHTTSNGMQVVE